MKKKIEKKQSNLKREFIIIETADKIKIQYKIASPILRAAGFFIDLMIFTALIYGLYYLLNYMELFNYLGRLFNEKLFQALTVMFWYVIIFLLRWFYYIFFEMLFNGKTPGKMMLGLRVINHDGRYLDLTAIVLRNFLRIFDQDMTFCIGATISILVNKEFRRVGDLIAGTIVIKEDGLQKKAPDFNIIHNETVNMEETTKKLVKKLNEDDLYILRKFLNSIDNFPVEKKERLIKSMASSIRNKISDIDEYNDPLEYLKTVYMRHNDEY